MAAQPKRRISTGRKGRRRSDKNVELGGRGTYVTSRDRRTAKRTATSQTSSK